MSPPMVIHSASPDAVGVNVMGSSSSVSGSVQNNNNDNNNMMGVGSPSSPFRPKDSRGRSAVRSNPISSNSINNINSISNDNSPMPIPSSHSALHYDVASTGVQVSLCLCLCLSSSSSLGLKGIFLSILVVSCFMRSGSLDSSDVLLPYSLITVVLHITTILISTIFQTYKNINM